MKHIRFLSNNKPVCEKPTMLGDDFLIVDYSGGDSCRDCLRLVVAHNAKVDRYDLTLATVPPVGKKEDLHEESDFVNGAIFATAFWLAVALTAWYIWFR